VVIPSPAWQYACGAVAFHDATNEIQGELMSKSEKEVERPSKFTLFLLKMPIWLYSAHMGWMLGKRFVLINHIGAKTGLPRRTVVEVVAYHPDTKSYFVCSGFGEKAIWYKNLKKTPKTTIQVGSQTIQAVARFLSPEEGADVMADYALRNPKAAVQVTKFCGHPSDGTESSYRQIAREYLKFIEFVPSDLTDSNHCASNSSPYPRFCVCVCYVIGRP
jgi:deazaflavin-dependent oxidoreductase (nitroreductase family)